MDEFTTTDIMAGVFALALFFSKTMVNHLSGICDRKYIPFSVQELCCSSYMELCQNSLPIIITNVVTLEPAYNILNFKLS